MFIFLDTETTGSGPTDRLCQIAFKTDLGLTVNELFNPGKPISIDAMSIHHITNEMVQDKPSFHGSAVCKQLTDLLNTEGNVMVAHNAAFDMNMLKRDGIEAKNAVCTLKLTRYLDTDGVIPRYSLQYLRYYLNIDVNANPHDALGDVWGFEALLKRIYSQAIDEFGKDAVEQMIEVSNSPVLYRKMPFGKHKGTKIGEVPADYLQWLSTTDLDEDLRYTVEHYLKK